MTTAQQIAQAVVPVVESWYRNCPGQPLVFRARGDEVEVRIGLRNSDRIAGAQAAEVLGINYRTFSRAHFYGLKRGVDHKFSRLSVERLRVSRAA